MKTRSIPSIALVILACTFQLAIYSNRALAAELMPPVSEGYYTLDKHHSTVTFRVSHLGLSFYTASFSDFDASLIFVPGNFAASKLSATINVSSLRLPTPPAGFLETLLGADWFNADEHPTITYVSTGINKTGAQSATVTGNLSMNGITRPVELEVQFNGGFTGMPARGPNSRVGFSARATVQRSEFNLAAGIPPAGSKLGVGDSVEIIIETEFSGPGLNENSN